MSQVERAQLHTRQDIHVHWFRSISVRWRDRMWSKQCQAIGHTALFTKAQSELKEASTAYWQFQVTRGDYSSQEHRQLQSWRRGCQSELEQDHSIPHHVHYGRFVEHWNCWPEYWARSVLHQDRREWLDCYEAWFQQELVSDSYVWSVPWDLWVLLGPCVL